MAITIDTWAYTTDSSANQRMIAGIGGGGANWSDSGGHQWIFYMYQNYLYFQSHVSGNSWNTVTSTSTVSIANAWHHLAVVCYNDTLTIYLDGTSVGSGTVSTVDVTTGGTQEFEIGSDATHQSPWQGYLDDFRVSKGVARWTSGFSVPTTEYTTAGYYTAAGDATVSGILNINSGTFSGSNKNITLSGSAPLHRYWHFHRRQFYYHYTGGGATNITGTTYYNLTLNHTGTTFTSAADSTVKGVFTITAGTFDASNDTLTLLAPAHLLSTWHFHRFNQYG